MKPLSLILIFSTVLLAPLSLAVCALFAGLWQREPEYIINEEELGI